MELGALVGVSPETIRKYEAGGRTPARGTLVRLVAALQLSAVQVRAILRGAGFAAADTMFPSDAYPDYYFTIAELRSYVEEVPWLHVRGPSATDPCGPRLGPPCGPGS
jgi:transcriptional regulator with XRE-family HTH domain